MRPKYETQHDLERQGIAAAKFCKAFRCVLHGLPEFYEVDFLVEFKGLMRGVCEVKCRDIFSYDYGTVILSLHKFKAMTEYGRLVGGSADLVVQFKDKMMTVNLLAYHPSLMKISTGGRHDRDDAQDTEPVIHIPLDWFTEVA